MLVLTFFFVVLSLCLFYASKSGGFELLALCCLFARNDSVAGTDSRYSRLSAASLLSPSSPSGVEGVCTLS